MLNALEENMAHYAHVLYDEFSIDYSIAEGSGAAGGLGAGLMAFCKAMIVPGLTLIGKLTHLEETHQKCIACFYCRRED